MEFLEYPTQHWAGLNGVPPQNHSSSIPDASAEPLSRHNRVGHDVEHRITHDSKPRLSKEQQDILEKHFQAQPKPTTATKKGFARDLGVPSDKINNWFQNRRAKVKQDARKQLGAQQEGQPSRSLNIFYATQPSSQITAERFSPGFVDSDVYQHLMSESTPRSLLSSNAPPTQIPNIPTPSENSDDLNTGEDDFYRQMHNMCTQLQGYAQQSFDNEDPEIFNTFFGLGNQYQLQDDNIDSSSISAFSKQFDPSGESFNSFGTISSDFGPYSTSASTSLLTRSSHNSSSIQLSALAEEEPMYRVSTSESSGDLANFGHTEHLQQMQGGSVVGQDQPKDIVSGPEPTQSTQQHFQMYQHEHPHSIQHGMDFTSTPFSEPVGAQQRYAHPSDQQQQQPDLIFQRRGSSSSMLVESPGNVENQSAPRPTTQFKQPGAASGLAARRQRRPAALGSAALRSSSYNGPSSSLQAANSHNIWPELKLRRIQSSNGVANGRIQKVNVPPQRSPLHFSFTEAASVAPTAFLRTSSTESTAPSHPSTKDFSAAPPTPSSPLGVQNGSSTANDDIVHSQVVYPTSASTAGSSMWPSSAHTFHALVSPPVTPLEAAQMAQLRLDSPQTPLGQNPHPNFSDPPMPLFSRPNFQTARSAPAWQQSFPVAHPHIPPAIPDAINVHNPKYHYRPSTAPQNVINLVQNRRQSMSVMPNRTNSESEQFRSVPQNQTHLEHTKASGECSTNQPFFAVQSSTFPEAQPTPPVASKATFSAAIQQPAEFLIQEYSPREPAEPAALPPRSKGSPPKAYTFSNQHPEHFSSP